MVCGGVLVVSSCVVGGGQWVAGAGHWEQEGTGSRFQQVMSQSQKYRSSVTISRSRMVSLSAMNIATSSTIAPISKASGWGGERVAGGRREGAVRFGEVGIGRLRMGEGGRG